MTIPRMHTLAALTPEQLEHVVDRLAHRRRGRPWSRTLRQRVLIVCAALRTNLTFRELAAVFEEQNGTWKLVSDPSQGFLRVESIVDTDGDGKVELIGAMDDFRMITGHFVPAATGFTPAVEVSLPNNDCGC